MSRTAPPTHLLYLHGFRSSPQSAKAQLFASHLTRHFPSVHWHCPQLPPSPRQAMQEVRQATAGWPRNTSLVIGSSLGGFYAAWLAQTTGWRAVLLNPAVDPARDLERYIGEQTQFHAPEHSFYFLPEYIQELRELATGQVLHPERCMAVIAKGDEVLNWREMAGRYTGCHQLLLEGGDHALSDTAAWWDAVLGFAGLRTSR